MNVAAGVKRDVAFDYGIRRQLQRDISRERADRFRANCALVSVLDMAGIGLALSGWLPLSLLLATHAALVLYLIHAARRHAIDAINQSESVIGTALFAVLGPAGGLAAICIYASVRYLAAPAGALSRWYRSLSPTIDPEHSLIISEEIDNGRSVSVGPEYPPNYPAIMKKGQLPSQSWVLARAASGYHSDYRGLLFDALRNPIPAIQVQAAAIISALRVTFRARIKAALRELESKSDIADAVNPSISILDQLGSGMLEDGDIDQSVAAIRRVFQAGGTLGPDSHARLKNHIVWAAGCVPDPGHRQKLLALATTISAWNTSRTELGRTASGKHSRMQTSSGPMRWPA